MLFMLELSFELNYLIKWIILIMVFKSIYLMILCYQGLI